MVGAAKLASHGAHGMGVRHPAPIGAADVHRLKSKLLAAAYTQHGVDLAALFARYDTSGCGALGLWSLGPRLQRMLPGVLTDRQVARLLATMDGDGDGAITCAEFVSFVVSRDDQLCADEGRFAAAVLEGAAGTRRGARAALSGAHVRVSLISSISGSRQCPT